MKKLFIASLVMLSVLNADTYKYIKLGGANHTIESESNSGVNFAFGTNKVYEHLFLGVDFNFDYAKIKESNLVSYYVDLKMGYSFYKKLHFYFIASALEQTYKINAYGFGYGGGVEYRVFKPLSIVYEYKTYSMTNNTSTYDYDNSGVYLQYNF